MLGDLVPQDATDVAGAELSPGRFGGPGAAPRAGDVGACGRRVRGWRGDGFGIVDGSHGGTERGDGVGVPCLQRGGEAMPERGADGSPAVRLAGDGFR